MPPKKVEGSGGSSLRELDGGERIPTQDTATTRAERAARRAERAASAESSQSAAAEPQTNVPTRAGSVQPRSFPLPPIPEHGTASVSSALSSGHEPHAGRITRSRSRAQRGSQNSSPSPIPSRINNSGSDEDGLTTAIQRLTASTSNGETSNVRERASPSASSYHTAHEPTLAEADWVDSHPEPSDSSGGNSGSSDDDDSENSDDDWSEPSHSSGRSSGGSDNDDDGSDEQEPLSVWFRIFWSYLWRYARHGLRWPLRHTRVFVSAVVGATLLLCAVLCSAGPICEFHSSTYLLYLYVRASVVEFSTISILYVLLIYGIWNALKGAARAIKKTGRRGLRPPVGFGNVGGNQARNQANSKAWLPDWQRPNDLEELLLIHVVPLGYDVAKLVIRPLLLLALTLSFADFSPCATGPTRTFSAALCVHMIKWCCQAVDATLTTRNRAPKRSRKVFWTCFSFMALLMLYQRRRLFWSHQYQDMARAYHNDEAVQQKIKTSAAATGNRTGIRDQSILEQVYVVVVETVTAGIHPTFPDSRLHQPSLTSPSVATGRELANTL